LSSGQPLSHHHRGRLFVVSAPSGTGKTTVAERLVGRLPGIVLSRSYTSRVARVGEQDGVDYHFVSRERFEAMIAGGEFLEWADVFGNLYGTCGPETERLLASGQDVVLVIDVQGAQQIRECGLAYISIFVLPPSFPILEQRLRGRSKDSDAAIRRRLEVASSEVSSYHDYDYVIVNDELDIAVDELRAIVVAERARINRMRPIADSILNTFPKRDQE
jgi:guanylate kinase